MASDEELITANNLDYLRFVLLLVEEGTAVVRKIVESGLDESENGLSDFLRINENEIRRSKRINVEQKELLYPSSEQKSNILKWDISLLAHIALKYFTTEGSDDHRAVEKLRDWRNKYFHCGEAAVDDGELEDLGNVIRTISQKYSRDEPTNINDIINSISKLHLYPALEKLKTVDPKLSERIEGMFGMIKGKFDILERCVQQTNQEVRELREEIRNVAERDGSEPILSVYIVHGLVHVTLRPDNPEALAEVIKRLYISASQNSLQHTDSSNHVEEMVANVSQDIRDIGGEVVDVQQGSVVYIINCSSLTALMYVIDYFYSPRMRYRLANIANDLSKDIDEKVELVSDILPKSLQEILQKLREANTPDKMEEGIQATSPPMSKFKAFLDKRKKERTQLAANTELVQQTVRKRKPVMTESRKLLDCINTYANRCRNMINEMQEMFSKKSDKIREYPHVKAWLKELGDIEKKLEFKPTVIAVIGNTGEGKSSLMNAILDKRDVLPTSGMKACTATVVEVVQSETHFYEAEIEFLKKEEWFGELRNLCMDLADDKTPSDRNSDIYNSYCKIKALYGEMDDFDVLKEKKEVTEKLGQTEPIKSTELDDFKKKVERYIEVKEPGSERCFWPIVKKVRLKLPECDVCSSGGVLVDLPGRGDSDATRNAVAKSYLETCDRIWIVSNINRAISDRTAQELLGEHFRTQFYMNGQFDVVSFICTKTDVLDAKEIQRELKHLESLTKEHYKELSELDERIKGLSKEIHKLTRSIEEDKKDVAEANLLLEDESDKEKLDDSMEEETMNGTNEDMQKYLEKTESEIKEKERKLRNFQIEVQKSKDKQNEKKRTIDEICSKERNAFCESRIKEDFASSYEAVRSASVGKANEESEQLQIENLTRNLKVFCISAKEYQMLEHMEPTDTGPKVFRKVEDTQIPRLRNFVHTITSTRRKETLKDAICTLNGFTTGIQTFLTDKGAMKQLDKGFTKKTIDSELKNLKLSNDSALEKLKSDLIEIFDNKLIAELKHGASVAADEAIETCQRWGAKYSRDRSQVGGLHHKTYQAAVKRRGVYIDIDFNEDLAQPIFTHNAFQWGNTFMAINGSVWKAVDTFNVVVLKNRKQILDKLLGSFSISKDDSKDLKESQDYIATIKVGNTVKELQDEISFKHRTIPGVVTPYIQSCLSDVYSECAKIKGKGMLENVKSKLSSEINEKSKAMFAQIADVMTSELHSIQESITNHLTEMGNDLTEELRTALESLWDDNTILRSAFSEDIGKLSLKVKGVLDEFSFDTEGPAQKRQKLQAQSESLDAIQGCSK